MDHLIRSGFLIALYSITFLATSQLGQSYVAVTLNLFAGVSFAFAALFGWAALPAIFVAVFVATSGMFSGDLSVTPIVQALVHAALFGVSGVRFGEMWHAQARQFSQYSAVTLFAVGLGCSFLSAIAARNVLKFFEGAQAQTLDGAFLSNWVGDFAGIMTAAPIFIICHAYLSDQNRSRFSDLVAEFRNSTQLSLLFSSVVVISVAAVLPDASNIAAHVLFVTLIPVALIGITYGVISGLAACLITTIGLIVIPMIVGEALFSVTQIEIFLAVSASISVITGGVRNDKDTALDAAITANRAKSRFLASASHDLRQPLQSATLYIDVLGRLETDPKHLEIIEKSQASLQATADILNALLDVSKLDAGLVTANHVSVPIANILERVKDIEPIAWEKGLTYKIVESSAVLRTDPTLLETIIRNIINNAVKYTDGGGVLVGARRTASGVRVEVWDTGPGIPADKLDAVFDEFYQLDNPQRDREQGMGLGLSIVKRLADLLGATLEVRSIVGQGTVVSITVPLAAS